jgi:hypothetical protein
VGSTLRDPLSGIVRQPTDVTADPGYHVRVALPADTELQSNPPIAPPPEFASIHAIAEATVAKTLGVPTAMWGATINPARVDELVSR